MWEHVIGRLVCSLVLLAALSAHAADGNREVFSPWTSAPTCPSGKACIYMLSSDGQLYVIDGSAVTTKLHGAKSFRTSANCAALSSPVNGDVCYDTTLSYFRVYSGGWKTIPLLATAPIGISGQTVSISYSSPLTVAGGSLALASSGLVYQTVTGGVWGVLGAATNYATHPGNAVSAGEVELAIVPRAGTAQKLYCHIATAPGGADTVVITARKNAADQALTCTITGAATACNDTTNTFAVSAADRLSMKLASSAGTAATISCTFEVTN